MVAMMILDKICKRTNGKESASSLKFNVVEFEVTFESYIGHYNQGLLSPVEI